jgi:hypothetical protein
MAARLAVVAALCAGFFSKARHYYRRREQKLEIDKKAHSPKTKNTM